MDEKTVPGWRITPDHSSPFVRTFRASPVGDFPVEYQTHERIGRRIIDATYPAKIAGVSVRYQWEPKDGGYWWGQASGDLVLVNEQTGLPYSSSWRKDIIRDHFASWETGDAPGYVKAILEATHPRSIITVTETPAWT